MKTNVLDMILYLFETYAADPMPTENKHELITEELVYAGFSTEQIQWAIDWLQFVIHRKYEVYNASLTDSKSLRVFNYLEENRLDKECRGYLLSLEQMGLLDQKTREIVMDGLLTLDLEVITLEEVKQVIQMVIAHSEQYKAIASWLKADNVSDVIIH